MNWTDPYGIAAVLLVGAIVVLPFRHEIATALALIVGLATPLATVFLYNTYLSHIPAALPATLLTALMILIVCITYLCDRYTGR